MLTLTKIYAVNTGQPRESAKIQKLTEPAGITFQDRPNFNFAFVQPDGGCVALLCDVQREITCVYPCTLYSAMLCKIFGSKPGQGLYDARGDESPAISCRLNHSWLHNSLHAS